MERNEYSINGFKITIIQKPDLEAIGYTRLVNLDGSSIGDFLKELAENRKLDRLTATLQHPQQVWVCLSGGDNSGFDCRCTVCIEKTEKHDFSQLTEDELFTLHAPASEWAIFEVGKEQSPTELHSFDVYKMIEEIGYTFNWKVGFHFDNEHEWKPGKTMFFLLPVIPK